MTNLVDVNLYGCLPDSKQNLLSFAKKSAANLYSALFVDSPGCPDWPTGPDAYPLANPSSILRTVDVLVDLQV